MSIHLGLGGLEFDFWSKVLMPASAAKSIDLATCAGLNAVGRSQRWKVSRSDASTVLFLVENTERPKVLGSAPFVLAVFLTTCLQVCFMNRLGSIVGGPVAGPLHPKLQRRTDQDIGEFRALIQQQNQTEKVSKAMPMSNVQVRDAFPQ